MCTECSARATGNERGHTQKCHTCHPQRSNDMSKTPEKTSYAKKWCEALVCISQAVGNASKHMPKDPANTCQKIREVSQKVFPTNRRLQCNSLVGLGGAFCGIGMPHLVLPSTGRTKSTPSGLVYAQLSDTRIPRLRLRETWKQIPSIHFMPDRILFWKQIPSTPRHSFHSISGKKSLFFIDSGIRLRT